LSYLERAAALWARPRVRLSVAAVAFAVLTAVTVVIGHYRMFTGFAAYDDEGYMLTALKGFVNHGHLYDQVFTQYGPFYYEFWGGIFSGLGITVTHDHGRIAALSTWIVASLLLGLVTMRLTRSLFLGLATQLLAFTALWVAIVEPMHPGGLISVLLAVIVGIACFVKRRSSPYAMALLGAAVAALFLVKINLGGFAVASVALVCFAEYEVLSSKRWLRIAMEVLFVAIPFLLMKGDLGAGWARHYAIHVAAAALAIVLALRARESDKRPTVELGWLVGGFLVLAVVCIAAILGAGTSVSGLIEGIIRQPLRQAGAFTIPWQLSRRLYAVDVVAIGAAAAYWYASKRRSGGAGPVWQVLVSLFSLGIGITMALSVTGKMLPFEAGEVPGYSISMLPFAFLALVAPPPSLASRDLAFGRLLLPVLAVLQALHAYPVAGSQTMWSSLLLIPVGILCVGNGVRGLADLVTEPSDRMALAGFAAVCVVVFSWFGVNAYIREPEREAHGAYDAAVPLNLPGAEDIRDLNPEEVQILPEITKAIDEDCNSLVMLPGMDSFYLWTEQEPPSYTATGWPTLFDDSHQEKVIEATRDIPDLCLLKNIPLAAGWGNGKIPRGPLVDYMNHDFKQLTKIQNYQLLRRDKPVPNYDPSTGA
jgi:hypothetical protein